MPYITKKRAAELSEAGVLPNNPGELNYMITRTCVDYLKRRNDNPTYAQRAEVVAALECAKLEFYRRKLADYEDDKRGDLDNVDPYF